jgi:hypothetical protein
LGSRWCILVPIVSVSGDLTGSQYGRHVQYCKRNGLPMLSVPTNIPNTLQHPDNVAAVSAKRQFKAFALDILRFRSSAVMLVLVLGRDGDGLGSKKIPLFTQAPSKLVCGVVGWVPLPVVTPISTPAVIYRRQRDVYTNTYVPSTAAFQLRPVEVETVSGHAHC